MLSKVLVFLCAAVCLAAAASLSVDERLPLLAAQNVTLYEDSLGDDATADELRAEARIHPSIAEDSRLTTVG